MITARYEIPEAARTAARLMPDGAEIPEIQRVPASRMRGIKDAAQVTGLPEGFIRKLALEGKIPAVRSGRKKIYINMDGLEAYLAEARLGKEV